nr:GFA family protein [uncultured Sphingomonas sp.]
MAEQHYSGGCQCGAVRYAADVDLDQTITCNCSRCKPMGFVLTMIPADKFDLQSGADATTEYLFNTHNIKHRFCTTCGVQSFATGEQNGAEMVAINVNTLDGVDARALNSQMFDGASH